MNEANNERITGNADELTLKDIILKYREGKKYLKSKWKSILIAGILGGILGFTYSYFKKPIYKARMTFALQENNSSGGGLGAAAGLASQFGIDLGGGGGGGAFTGDNLLELLKSRSMVENTLLTSVNIKGKMQTLAELYISFNRFRESWRDIPLLKNINFPPNADRSKFTLQQDSLLGNFYNEIIKKNLKVEKLDKKLSIITIGIDSKNELFSKFFIEELAKNVSDFYINTKTKRSIQNVNILQHQTDSVRKELNSSINGEASSSDANPNINPALQILRVNSRKHEVDVNANTAILTELVKNLEISKVSLRKETPLIQVIDRPILPLEKEKIGKIAGFILGGFIFVFFTILFLLCRKVFRSIMA